MEKIKEIGKIFDILFCIDEEVNTSILYDTIGPIFKNISRSIPSLIVKYLDGHGFSLLIIDEEVDINEKFQEDILLIQKRHPLLPMVAQCDKNDTIRMSRLIELNIDRIILTPQTHEYILNAVERILSFSYEIQLTSAYENKLENIITGQTRKIYTQQMHDTLTGLKNSAALKESFNQRSHKGLIFLDVDSFDTVNTLYGMRIGDKVLQMISKRLNQFLPNNCELFRISADEFAIIVQYPKETQLQQLSEQILAMFYEAPVAVGDIQFDITFSAGHAVGDDYEIFYNAKLANREAKYLGGHTSVAHSKDSFFLQQQHENHFWVNEIKDALKNDRIIVYYQPMYNNKERCISKFEALARLENKNGDIIAPRFFIKPAILAKLICDISRMVIDKTFKTFSKNDYEFSINVTDQDFKEKYLENFLLHKCKFYKIEPKRVYLEILEEMSLNDTDNFLEQVRALKRHGFNISIDDFGVEKSNYSRVIDLEAEIIKIDGSFISTLQENINSRIIVESIVSFAKRIGAKTVAEFVETKEVFDTLEALGVDYAQGYLIGKAEPSLQCAILPN